MWLVIVREEKYIDIELMLGLHLQNQVWLILHHANDNEKSNISFDTNYASSNTILLEMTEISEMQTIIEIER